MLTLDAPKINGHAGPAPDTPGGEPVEYVGPLEHDSWWAVPAAYRTKFGRGSGMSEPPAGDLKTEVLQIADIAQAVPEALREKCFELLLQDLLERRTYGRRGAGRDREVHDDDDADEEEQVLQPRADESSDIELSDLHVKARSFLERNKLTLEEINQILYKEGDQFLPLFDDLKTTKLSESQIRVALLEALRTALQTGDFTFNGENVRQECMVRKCYDQSNFAATFKNNALLFDGFETYNRSDPVVKLSEAGRKELADLVRELQ